MTIPPDLEAQILRYHLVEKWTVGTIARQLQVHSGTVKRGVGGGRPAEHRGAGAPLADRSVPAVHPGDAGEVPDADRRPAQRDGA
jgi:hypothetical protein